MLQYLYSSFFRLVLVACHSVCPSPKLLDLGADARGSPLFFSILIIKNTV